MNYSMKTRILQAAAGIIAAGAVAGAAWPGTAAGTGEKILRFAQDDKGAVAVGTLVIPGRAAEPETEPEPLRHGGLSDAEIYELKLDRWRAVKEARKEQPEPETEALYTEEDLRLLAITIYCEAGSDSISDETRRMVGEVVLNRVADDRFPDSIEEVLTQPSQYGRFHWTGVVLPSRAASEPEAVDRAYECARMVFTEERLLPEDVVYQAEFVQGEIVASAPGFYFCR